MSGLLERLLNIARSHLNDFIDPLRPDYTIPPYWDLDDTEPEEPFTSYRNRADGQTSGFDGSKTSGTSARTSSGLPYSTELAHCYELLDLPFGVPMDKVNKRWKTYLKRCHPDLYTQDPVQQAEATELTQALMGAQSKIEAALSAAQQLASL